MILQCDQCNTKFRLDDSKLKPGGVKVRCSKCRHVFVAGAEQRAEESDFDALLSGLGAPTPAQAAAPPSAQAGEEASLPESGAESAASQQDDAFGFDVAPESEVKAGSAPAGAEAAVSGDFDFGDINVETGMPAGQEAPLPAAGEFGEIEFNEEPVAAAPRTPAAPDLDFGELSFDEPPAATTEPAPAAADASLDFGDFSFEEPAPAGKEEAAPPVADAMAFGELSFEESAPQAKEERGAAAQPAEDAFDFGEFSFDENPAPAQEVPAETPAVDFGEFSFEETPAAAKEEAAPAETDAVEFGDFSFEEPAASQNEEPAPAAGDSFDFGDFSFEDTTAPAQAQSSEPEPASFSFTEEAVAAAPVTPDYQNEEGEVPGEMAAPARQGGEQGGAPARDEEFSFGDFSFSETPTSPPSGHEDAAPAAAAAGLAGAAAAVAASQATEAPSGAAEPSGGKPTKSSLDFSFGDKSFAAAVPEQGFEEELPPLSISSRRKGHSALTVAIVAISAIVVLALSGAGLYLMQSGPEAMKKLDKFGIGFVAKWLGMEVPEEGRITIKNALASFHQNKEAGELFVVNGEAVNSFRKARASIQVKVSIFDKGGKVLLQKTAFCGNRLSAEQLSTLPMAKIESIMNNQFGDSLSNLGVKPDQSIGFVVAIANVPKEAADFGVEVVGSTVATGQ
ncbi:DUF3426 domain-containing protein [Geomonas subterranea]|uniref:DUF3426 domain-containing protein n=1 Tax=Geomonas subterranea TaxID=2847989 RepID=UPI001CD3FFA1|nr:DUF3426 domain-containing protein [Geomonas fuzhouensis]